MFFINYNKIINNKKMNIFILYTMYIRFSIIKEKLNILLSNIYLKKEKKTCFKLKFLKRCWCRVIQ